MLCKWLSQETAAAGEGALAARVSQLSVLDTGVFDELWESLKWRMPSMRKIYESFVSVATETLSMFRERQPGLEPSDTSRRLHSLLGSAGLVGARQVEYLAAWLSDAVKARRTDDIERALDHLRRAMDRFQQELDRRFNVLEGRG
jgi:HPt (histidine-containing phosphotransfer) domain-containing protein